MNSSAPEPYPDGRVAAERPAGSLRRLGRSYAWNLVNTLSGVVFYLVTFPYAARVLGPECIGRVNFYQSIVTYIALACGLGIPVYGVREIARLAGDVRARANAAVEILVLHLLLTLLGGAVVAVLCLTVDAVRADVTLFLVVSSSLLFMAVGCEWFFRGTEDFRYITLRGLVVRVVYVVVLFVWVRSPEQLVVYGALTVLGTYGSHLLNLGRLRRRVAGVFDRRSLRPQRHFKGALRVFGLTVATAVYVNLNVVFLGFISGDEAVGYYMGAMKILTVPLGVLTALQTSLLPRMSAVVAGRERNEFVAMARKAVNLVWCLGLPMGVGLALLAAPVVELFCGPEYEPAVAVLRILGPAMLLIAMVVVLGSAVFIPLGREADATRACVGGALVSLAGNLLLIPAMAQNGAAWSAVAAEAAVASLMGWWMWRRIGLRPFNSFSLIAMGATAVMAVVCLLMLPLMPSHVWSLTVVPVVGAGVYALCLHVARAVQATA